MMATSENKRNRVAVVYICTGKYKRFFADFYESAKAYLLKDVAEVRYFVFTDDMELTKADDVELIKRECQGFPADSLGRFDMFLSIEDRLQAYDYTFFFNANMKFGGKRIMLRFTCSFSLLVSTPYISAKSKSSITR